jgi:prepilin-type processing-associated H-X9-DG protein
MIPDSTPSYSARVRYSLRAFFGLVAVFAVSLTPLAYFGWKGVLSSICLFIAGVFFISRRRGLAITIIVLLLVGQFFYPALDGAREAILRSDCATNIRRLTYAIHEYESNHGHIPPPYSTDSDGNVLHCWRVLILPYLGEPELYEKIDLRKPWNDAVNVPFHKQMPDVFCCPAVKYHSRWLSTGDTTAYTVIADDLTAWRVNSPPTLGQFVKGTSRTIAIIESEKHRVNWMCPTAPTIEKFLTEIDFSRPHNGVLNFSFFDGSTTVLSEKVEPEQIRQLLTIDAQD